VGLREKLDAFLGVPKQEEAQATEENRVIETDFTEHITGLKTRVSELEGYNAIYKKDIERNEKDITQLKAIISKLEEPTEEKKQ
jgi:hypothetical protein